MTTSISTAPNPPVTLLTLPLDIIKEIFDYLTHDNEPTLAILRRTHSSFLAAIPKSDLRTKPTAKELCQQLRTAYHSFNYLLPIDHVPCYYCNIVGPKGELESDETFVPTASDDWECKYSRLLVYKCRRCKAELSAALLAAQAELAKGCLWI